MENGRGGCAAERREEKVESRTEGMRDRLESTRRVGCMGGGCDHRGRQAGATNTGVRVIQRFNNE